MPDSRIAVVHGGVDAVCEHGSSVTYKVPPFARSPACRSAVISACGPGLGEVVPSPAIWPSFTTMAPTGGRGPTIPIAEEASSRARIKAASSLFMKSWKY